MVLYLQYLCTIYFFGYSLLDVIVTMGDDGLIHCCAAVYSFTYCCYMQSYVQYGWIQVNIC